MTSPTIPAQTSCVEPNSVDMLEFAESLPLELASIRKNSVESVRISFALYKGNVVLNLRVWIHSANGKEYPSPKGLTVAIWHVEDLANALAKAVEIAHRYNLVRGEVAI